ncbi:recombination mediator RecR [uncultured Mailhella sp.]|uniref:recombination mediator RecR n=1 Tax=uncultured Mailhella sp. TaxID=1981031 RepID=UPI002633CF9C|nr:recombination mediator RecR [uncultured Mailhella sp.]
MVQRIPEPLKLLVEQLARLPGLGPKSAMRAAMTLLKWPEAEVRQLGRNVYELRDALHLCSRCGGLADSDPCPLCADPVRDPAQLCLVAEWDSMLTLEEGNFYKGFYMILGGLLAPLDHSPAEALEMERLHTRLAEGQVRELILALGATAEAEATATYVRDQVASRFPDVRITRLAQGIPLGAEVKYMDRETLRQSLQYRQPL